MKKQRWHYLPTPPTTEVTALSKLLNTVVPLTTILLQRGITDFEAARAFFCPASTMLHNPMAMKGMQQAVARIGKAIQRQETICVYGDYDVDGVTSVALLYRALRKAGAQVIYYLPDRHKEGYGVSAAGVAFCIEQKVSLLITIDCGIKAVAPLTTATAAGIEVIICDHHEPGAILPPALAILNPKQKTCNYPFKELSGCAIGYKLLQGLVAVGHLTQAIILPFLDLVAVSIAADIVPMVGENRILTYYGLQRLNESPCLGLAALKKQVNRGNSYTVSDIVFGLAPRINAAGRVSHAQRALLLLLATDTAEATAQAKLLSAENEQRKTLDSALLAEALALLAADKANAQRSTTVVFAPHWHKGVLGIAAARCVEQHYRPAIVLTQQGDYATGSARSVAGYNIYDAIAQCTDLLTAFGGHAYAAGLTLPIAKLSAFQDRFEAIVRRTITSAQLTPCQVIDTTIDFEQITHSFYNVIMRMGPFGPAHRRPVFATTNVIVKSYNLYQEKHLALRLQQPGNTSVWHAIGFNMAHLLPLITRKQPLTVAYTIESNLYGGFQRYQLMLKDLQADTSQALLL